MNKYSTDYLCDNTQKDLGYDVFITALRSCDSLDAKVTSEMWYNDLKAGIVGDV